MKEYYINIPAVAGSMVVFGYDEKSARQSARDRFGYGKRLPKGTKLYEKVKENPCDYSHVIRFNGQSVTCHGHTNESVTELTRRYYEGKYSYKCSILDHNAKEIYKTA